MKCAVCGAPCDLMVHDFLLNTPKHWEVLAPLYYKSAPDFRGMIEPYCGSACSLKASGRSSSERRGI